MLTWTKRFNAALELWELQLELADSWRRLVFADEDELDVFFSTITARQ